MIIDGANNRFWNANMKLYIDNTHYLLITNTFAGNNDVAWSGLRLTNDMVVTPIVKSNVATVLGGGIVTIRPPVGEKWNVTTFGGSVWIGVAPDQFPDVALDMTDGTIASRIARNSDYASQGFGDGIVIDNTNYLTLTDTGGAGGAIGYTACLLEIL
jgi:hypothetical protein